MNEPLQNRYPRALRLDSELAYVPTKAWMTAAHSASCRSGLNMAITAYVRSVRSTSPRSRRLSHTCRLANKALSDPGADAFE